MDDKPFRIEARLKNNRLIKVRQALGFVTVKAAAETMGVKQGTLGAFETLHRSPISTKTGTWSDAAQRIASFYRTMPEDLWPECVRQVEETRLTLEVEASAIMLADPQTPEDRLLEDEQSRCLRKAVAMLTPRQQHVIIRRFNLDNDDITPDDLARSLDVGKKRIYQIEQKALKQLRHPALVKTIKGDM